MSATNFPENQKGVRGGRRPGSGRPRTYRGRTIWATIPLPAPVAEQIGTGRELRARLLAILREARPNLRWEEEQ